MMTSTLGRKQSYKEWFCVTNYLTNKDVFRSSCQLIIIIIFIIIIIMLIIIIGRLLIFLFNYFVFINQNFT